MTEEVYAIEIEDVWKSFRSGAIRGRTLIGELAGLWDRVLGRENKSGRVVDRRELSLREASRNRRFWALKGVSFKLRKGEVVAVLGRNGAGKSTLLQILSRITEADKGVIRIRGTIASLLGAGVGFNDEMTGRENVYLNGSILGMHPGQIAARMEAIAAFAEIPEFMDTPVKRYSNGMRSRLGFSVAVNLDADIMVLDEVFAAGDRVFRKKCIGKMHELAKSGRTILIVTHIPGLLKGLCERGVVLRDGHMIFDGDIDHALDLYLENGGKGDVDDDSGEEQRSGGVLKVRIRDDKGLEISSVEPQGFLGFEVDFESQMDIVRACVLVSLHHPSLGIISRFQTPVRALGDLVSGEKVRACLSIPCLPLGSDLKDVECRVRLVSKGASIVVMGDWSQWLAITPRDGKMIQGAVICDHRWDCVGKAGADDGSG